MSSCGIEIVEGNPHLTSTPLSRCNHFSSVDMRRGIPNITLDGSKDDWQKILQRLDRLYELGDEPSVWATMLRPILRRFVSAFDGEVDVHFWEHLVYLPFDPFEMLVVNGWITAFCVWNFFGKWQGGSLPEKIPRPPSRLKVDAKRGVVGTRLKKLFRVGLASTSDGSAGVTKCEDGRQVDGWDMKDLEDPEGHLGEPEELTLIANSEFSSEFPEVAEWMGNLSLSDDEYAELEVPTISTKPGIQGSCTSTRPRDAPLSLSVFCLSRLFCILAARQVDAECLI